VYTRKRAADFKIAVSQVEFLRGLLEQLRLPYEAERQVQAAMHRNGSSALDLLMEEFQPERSARDMLLAWRYSSQPPSCSATLVVTDYDAIAHV